MKKCKKCELEKELSEFTKDKHGKQGVRPQCKECQFGYKPHKPAEIEKECIECKLVKPLESFSMNGKDLKYRKSKCKVCVNKYRANKRKQDPEREFLRKRKIDLRQKYKMTLEDFDVMFKTQNGKCKVCPRKVTSMLHIDHCHSSGTVRGLLCQKCNHALGMVDDSIEILEKLINYLKETNTSKEINYN